MGNLITLEPRQVYERCRHRYMVLGKTISLQNEISKQVPKGFAEEKLSPEISSAMSETLDVSHRVGESVRRSSQS